jgi:hypothetical protein
MTRSKSPEQMASGMWSGLPPQAMTAARDALAQAKRSVADRWKENALIVQTQAQDRRRRILAIRIGGAKSGVVTLTDATCR